MVKFPSMIRVRQLFSDERIENLPETLSQKLIDSGLMGQVKRGSRIAVTAGSRGISGIPEILRTIGDNLKASGAKPFVVPAMGSHGGGTAGGQLNMLESLGVTEDSVGIPVISSTDTVELGETASGAPVYMDKNAYDSDGIVAVNRIKPHTAYHGRIESGLCKMVTVGLGKKGGAETVHRMGLGEVIVESFRLAAAKSNIIFGVALLENAFDHTLDIRVVPPGKFETTDSELLERSRKIIPKIPVPEFDILIVDEMGKNISGTGMDTNVIGFWRRFGGEKIPDYTTLIVRNLTRESHGNAMGIGLADLTTHTLVDSMDMKATYTNAITSEWSMGRIPITLKSDSECISVAIEKHPPRTARIVRIKNTLHLDEFFISENLLEALIEFKEIEVAGEPEPMRFEEEGGLI
ncbi:lactate racemase domain-containing protein [Candidatus Latescibacterota bacterium]